MEQKRFASLEDLESFIKDYEQSNFVILYKRDSRKISNENEKKKCPLKANKANKDLVYTRIIYSCAKGGMRFKSRSTGQRRTR